MNDYVSAAYEPLVHWLAAWTVVVAAVVLIRLVFRPQRPTVRYAGWLLAMFSGPIVLALSVSIEPIANWRQIVGVHDAKRLDTTRHLERFQSILRDDGQFVPAWAERAAERFEQHVQRASSPSPESAVASVGTHIGHAEPEDAGGEGSAVEWLRIVWIIGVCFFLVRLARQLWKARAVARQSTLPVGPHVTAAYKTARQRIGVHRKVRLAVHATLRGPIFLGGLRAARVWPAPENDLMTNQERHAAMVHELAHARRRDDWVNLAAELWRAATWFYLPVHLLVVQLRREQEFLCDDLAASQFDRPLSYAELLLHVAPVRLHTGCIGTRFVGPGLQGRIRRFLGGRLRPTVPLSRIQIAGLAIVGAAALVAAGSLRLVGLAEEVTVAANADDPLPDTTPAELAEAVREALKTYEAGVIEATYVESRVRDDLQPPQTVAWEGRFQYASDGYRWRGEYESQSYSRGTPGFYLRGWSAGFDGEVHYRRELRAVRDEFVMGEQQAHEGIPLLELFWSSHGAGFPRSLAENDWQLDGQETVGGHRCYVLLSENEVEDSRWRSELTLSPRQNHLPVRYKVFSNDKLSYSHELFDLAQTETGIWYPRKIRKVQTFLSNRIQETRIDRYESDPFFDAAYFRPRIPWGVHVRDWRTGEIYKNDPWWPEVGPLVHAQFDWPPPDFIPLRGIASSVDPEMSGQPAPPLSVDEWLRGGPVDLAQRRGKVTLLFFSGGSLWHPNPQWVSGLRELYEVYQPFGLEIVGINTHTSDLDAARQQAQELRMPWPVAVDAEAGSLGRTFEAYGLQTYISPVLIDHEGKIRLVQGGHFPEQVKEVLEEAGVVDAPSISMDFTQQPVELPRQIGAAWRELVRNAARPARITGKVLDDKGPLPLVEVEGNLRLELAGDAHTTGSTTFVRYRDEVFRATTNDDGTFELAGLCKGAYTVRFKLPGRAFVEKRVVVAPDELEQVVDADLTQPDGLRGRVVDGSGKPIGGANVTIRHRHPNPANPRAYSTYHVEPALTDAQGRFRFENLQTGSYTLDISHAGFQDGLLEHVPAGQAEAVVKLVKRLGDE